MENENWSEKLTEEQQLIMKVLGGYLPNITDLFVLLTKDMEARKAYLCKLGYLETLGKSLKLDEYKD